MALKAAEIFNLVLLVMFPPPFLLVPTFDFLLVEVPPLKVEMLALLPWAYSFFLDELKYFSFGLNSFELMHIDSLESFALGCDRGISLNTFNLVP